MIAHPDIDPTAFTVFDWPVRWYGLMYLLAFAAAFFWGRRLLRRAAFSDVRGVAMDDLLLPCVFGVILGGRLGYALFYNPALYLGDPAQIARLWDGGMSFHGGLLGVIVALFLYARRAGLPLLRVADFAAALTPIGLGLGRIGNFINGELPGRPASPDLPWAMIFPGDSIARHPSSLYQAFLEGAALFVVLYFFAARRRAAGFLSGAFLLGYALLRIISELFREPDAHLGFVLGGLSMGQLLSFPMLLGGLALLTADKWIPFVQRARAPRSPETVLSDIETPPRPEDETQNDNGERAPEAEYDPPAAKNNSAPPDETSEEETEDDEPEREEDEARTAAPWWKTLFAARKEGEAETPSRRRSRRDSRRQKKKRRRR